MKKIFLFSLLALPWLSIAKEPGNKFKTIVKTQEQSEKAAKKSQIKINNLDDEAQNLLQEYRLTLKRIYNTQAYNDQLRNFIKKQKEEMISLRKQIEQVKDTGKDILPLISRMLHVLEQFIQLDMPFLLEQRQARVLDLKKIMDRTDVSTSEKYRKLLDVYEIENEYGRTISAYKGIQNIKSQKLTVNFLRVGRVAFMYQSLNKKHSAYWDNGKKEWIKLPGKYKDSLSKGLAVAKKQRAPEILKVPIKAPSPSTQGANVSL